MNTIKNRLIQKLLLNKKTKKQNGFTLIELMVVVAIVGILTAVGLPELTKAQDKAKSAAAKSFVVNEGKSCSLELVTGGTYSLATAPTNVELVAGSACAAEGSIAATGGGETWTVSIDTSGVAGIPAGT